MVGAHRETGLPPAKGWWEQRVLGQSFTVGGCVSWLHVMVPTGSHPSLTLWPSLI